ncbi:hypothetical protein [Pseudomonas shirazensis]
MRKRTIRQRSKIKYLVISLLFTCLGYSQNTVKCNFYKRSETESIYLETDTLFFSKTGYKRNIKYFITNSHYMSGKTIIINKRDTIVGEKVDKSKESPGIKLYEIRKTTKVLNINYKGKNYVIKVLKSYNYILPYFNDETLESINYYQYVPVPMIY